MAAPLSLPLLDLLGPVLRMLDLDDAAARMPAAIGAAGGSGEGGSAAFAAEVLRACRERVDHVRTLDSSTARALLREVADAARSAKKARAALGPGRSGASPLALKLVEAEMDLYEEALERAADALEDVLDAELLAEAARDDDGERISLAKLKADLGIA